MDRVLRDADAGQGDGFGLTNQQLWRVEPFEEDGVPQDSVSKQAGYRAGGGVAFGRTRRGGAR